MKIVITKEILKHYLFVIFYLVNGVTENQQICSKFTEIPEIKKMRLKQLISNI